LIRIRTYRAHVPRWAGSPTNDIGGARAGGRFNRKDVEALHLAAEDVTALREYQQLSFSSASSNG